MPVSYIQELAEQHPNISELPEIGGINKGYMDETGDKNKPVESPYFIFESDDNELVDRFKALYGDEKQGGEVFVIENVSFASNDPLDYWLEDWRKGKDAKTSTLIRRCDGETQVKTLVDLATKNYTSGAACVSKSNGCQCKVISRLPIILNDFEDLYGIYGIVKLNSTARSDAQHWVKFFNQEIPRLRMRHGLTADDLPIMRMRFLLYRQPTLIPHEKGTRQHHLIRIAFDRKWVQYELPLIVSEARASRQVVAPDPSPAPPPVVKNEKPSEKPDGDEQPNPLTHPLYATLQQLANRYLQDPSSLEPLIDIAAHRANVSPSQYILDNANDVDRAKHNIAKVIADTNVAVKVYGVRVVKTDDQRTLYKYSFGFGQCSQFGRSPFREAGIADETWLTPQDIPFKDPIAVIVVEQDNYFKIAKLFANTPLDVGDDDEQQAQGNAYTDTGKPAENYDNLDESTKQIVDDEPDEVVNPIMAAFNALNRLDGLEQFSVLIHKMVETDLLEIATMCGYADNELESIDTRVGLINAIIISKGFDPIPDDSVTALLLEGEPESLDDLAETVDDSDDDIPDPL